MNRHCEEPLGEKAIQKINKNNNPKITITHKYKVGFNWIASEFTLLAMTDKTSSLTYFATTFNDGRDA